MNTRILKVHAKYFAFDGFFHAPVIVWCDYFTRSVQTRICFSTLFRAERLRRYSPGAPNINVSPPLFFARFTRKDEESRTRFLRPFFNFNPRPQFCLLSRTRAYCVFRHFASHGDLSFCLQRTCPRIQSSGDALTRKCSRILSEDNGLLCFFPATGPSGRATPSRFKKT